MSKNMAQANFFLIEHVEQITLTSIFFTFGFLYTVPVARSLNDGIFRQALSLTAD